MPPRAIKRHLTCPIEFTFGSSLIGRNGILVTPRDHLVRQHQNDLSGLSFDPLAFLRNACFFNAGLEHSRSDLVSGHLQLNHIFARTILHEAKRIRMVSRQDIAFRAVRSQYNIALLSGSNKTNLCYDSWTVRTANC